MSPTGFWRREAVANKSRLCSLLAVLALTACAAQPTGAPPAAGPAATPASSEWAQTMAAAKQEGKVVILGPQGAESNDALVIPFQAKYPDISVDFTGMSGNQAVPKVLTEQAAGQYLNDLYLGGPTGILNNLRPQSGVVPIAPYLTGPSIGTPNDWRGGGFTFADREGKYSLMFSLYAREAFIYNPDQVAPGEFTSWRDLLNPKWKGKIVMRDPRGSGGGLGYAVLWYEAEGLGPDFIRQLIQQQDLVISTDDRQIIDWVVRGQYAIGIGQGNQVMTDFITRGLPLGTIDGLQLKEGTYITPGAGNAAVLTNPPHPNATRVYLDWLLSEEGQSTWMKTIGFPSTRKLSTDKVLPVYVLKDGATYFDAYSESYAPKAEEVTAFVEPLLRR